VGLKKVDGGTAEIELECLGKPKRNCGREDCASEKQASVDNRWTVDRDGGDIKIY